MSNTDGLTLHHTSTGKGYMSRKKLYGTCEVYKGRFGEGIIKRLPSFDSNRYHIVEYWVK